MPAHTVLFDFTVDKSRIINDSQRNELLKIIRSELEHIFPQLKFTYDMLTDDGFLFLFSENNLILITIRFYNQGLITLNVEYFHEDNKEGKFSYETSKSLEAVLRKKLSSERSKYLPPIKRGGKVDVYLTSSDERLIEYDIDKVLFDKRSQFQKVQIVHSKTLGNMLVLDDLQNLSEADLIYTETLMQRGVENFEGKEILILGGGDGALLYELLKEKPKFVTMLEIDEVVMAACNDHMKSICGEVLEKRKGDNYEIIVGDCMVYIKEYIKEGRKFDYVFGDLTDIPISDTPTGEIWNFLRSILEQSFKVLKPDGKYMTHGNGASCPESLKMYEQQLDLLQPPVKYARKNAFVPSFMEDWIFYQVTFA